MTDHSDTVVEIAEIPLRHLERRFTELAAGTSASGDTAQDMAENAITTDEAFAQIIAMAYNRGIAMAMEIAAEEISKARDVLHQALEETKGQET